jgi:hypothetical protein
MLGNFRGLVNSLELKEIPLIGRRFTWSNQRDVPTLVKLDHVFCTTDWEDYFPHCSLHSNATSVSDHCPLTLKVREVCLGKRRFHFESFWPKIPGFLEVVAAMWNQLLQDSCTMEKISLKLKILTKCLQSWGHKEVGNVNVQLGLAREAMHRLEMARDNRILSREEIWLLRQLKQHCLVLASLQRTIARLRSRIQFLKEGDANTQFFHRHACYRKKRKFISKLEDDGRVITNHDDIQVVLDGFFSNLLGADFQRHVTIDLSSCHRDAVDLSALDNPFLEKEVRDTVAGLPSDKAPGVDGFTGRFYKTCWNIIKEDLLAALNSLHQGNAHKLGLLNSDYLILLPKRLDVMSASDYRPISLSHSFAKLVTKLLANRLGPRLHELEGRM